MIVWLVRWLLRLLRRPQRLVSIHARFVEIRPAVER